MINNMKQISESRLFSAHAKDRAWNEALRGSSMSTLDANRRRAEYQKLFSRYESMRDAYVKYFSGVSEIPVLSNQYFNATIASFVRSFAGYFTIERDMNEPTALLWYDDVLGVVDDRRVLTNVGPENLDNIDNKVMYENITIDSNEMTVTTGQVLVPGSVQIELHSKDRQTRGVIVDDSNGNLMAAAGVLETGTVDYKSGKIVFKVVGSAFASGIYTLSAHADAPGAPTYGSSSNNQNNRFKLSQKNVIVTSVPDELIGESNLVAMAQAQKSMGQNIDDVMGAKLVELYTKILNKSIAKAVMGVTTGNAYEIDMSNWSTSYYDYSARLNAFSAEMINLDTELADKSTKGVEATAYLVGKKAGNWFRKLRQTGEFTENKGSTYVNDLLGYYHEIPVVRHLDVPENEIYAAHKTAGGEIAPVMLGQYLPLTFSPRVGSYNNPTQLAEAVFYQLGLKGITDALVVKAKIKEA